MRIWSNIWDTEASEGIARSITTCVDPFHLLEGDVTPSLLSLERPVVSWSHLGVRIVARVGELVARAHRVEELDRLVCACCHKELRLGQITELNDGGVVRLDPLVAGDVPRWPRLEELNEVSLEVPDQQLARLTLLASRLVFLVGALTALLKLVRGRHRWVCCSWEGALRWLVVLLIEVFLS